MSGGRWVGGAVGLLLMSLLLGLGVAWCSIERYDLAYKLTTMRERLDEAEDLVAKLEVERDNLLSPHRLRAKARELGLGPAAQGRIRRIETPTGGGSESGE